MKNGNTPAGMKIQTERDREGGTIFVPENGTRRATTKPARPKPSFDKAHECKSDYERKRGKVTAQWTYTDVSGQPVGMVLRWDLPDGGKTFRQISRGPDGKWRPEAMPTPRPLFDIPSLQQADQVIVVEGEKAADAARSIGLNATTSPGGSPAAQYADWSPLSGRDVAILPDNDQKGQKYRDDVAVLAGEAGARSVKIVQLPGLPDGGDIVEFIGAKGADQAKTEIARMIEKATPIKSGGPVLRCLADVEPEKIKWLWPGRVALGS